MIEVSLSGLPLFFMAVKSVICNVKLKLFSILLFCTQLVSVHLKAQEFQMSNDCQKAYQAFMAMKIDLGKSFLRSEIDKHPKNILPHILINYEDFISLTFNENQEKYKLQKTNLSKRIQLLELADKQSPYFLFCKALLYYQWSIIRIRHNDYWDGVWDFRKSHALFKENHKMFPNFLPNKIFLGSQEALISTIPNGYKWVSNLLGMHGEMKNGIGNLRLYLYSNESAFREEACFYYVYLKTYLENDVEGAYKFIQDANLDIKNNQLFAFMAANIALNNKNAMQTESILLARTKSKEYMNFPMLDYEMGCAKLRQLDFSASTYFLNFLKEYKGHFYVKDSYHQLALAEYLKGNHDAAKIYLKKIISNGKTESDADKQAQKFAKQGIFPNVEILKARLLNDGGNNQSSLKICLELEKSNTLSTNDILELNYRMARVYDDLSKFDEAIKYYKKTIALGSKSTEYYAARAALQCGFIYANRKNVVEAKRYFQLVLDLDDHDYKNSLDQRAKSALNRL